MVIFSVALSLYLGYFVPAGVALYWTSSNLLAILIQWFLNVIINPKKYVDYENLEKLQKEYNVVAEKIAFQFAPFNSFSYCIDIAKGSINYCES